MATFLFYFKIFYGKKMYVQNENGLFKVSPIFLSALSPHTYEHKDELTCWVLVSASVCVSSAPVCMLQYLCVCLWVSVCVYHLSRDAKLPPFLVSVCIQNFLSATCIHPPPTGLPTHLRLGGPLTGF